MATSRPPAVVIVARHGARLDVADKQWHLTSPAPYDPPLTYGGWNQCRALGGKIASLLKTREILFEQAVKEELRTAHDSDNSISGGTRSPKHGQARRPRKHRVIIHSSPFLRCVQTSIAISAGISQYQDYVVESSEASSVGKPKPFKTKRASFKNSNLSPIQDEDEGKESGSELFLPYPTTFLKPRLRIDAFLGEWLSPDYYDCITPPPNSVMMVATAKAELLRKDDRLHVSSEPARNITNNGNFPGGWANRREAASPASEEEEVRMQLADSKITPEGNQIKPTQSKTHIGYSPPVPPYAVSSSEPIPAGYVQHARDECIEVDFQWDSMRAPLDWGDGGELGEEWSSMHKRFRKGLHDMTSWYSHQIESSKQMNNNSQAQRRPPEESDDEDADIVLILVTHGAGCNALIGALTNQPVLLDVAMSSLTMAVHRGGDGYEAPAMNSPMPSMSYRSTSRSLSFHTNERPIPQTYQLTLTASTDHLTTSPFTPLNLSDLQTKSAGTSDDSVSRRSSRRRLNPNPLPTHDRSASLSQLPPSNFSTDRAYFTPQLHSTISPFMQPAHVGTSDLDKPLPVSAGLWSRSPAVQKPTSQRTWSIASVSSSSDQVAISSGSSSDTLGTPANVTFQDGFDGGKGFEAPLQLPNFGLADGIQGSGTGDYKGLMGNEDIMERERGMKRRWTTVAPDRWDRRN